ncbi:MAG: aldehyde ferredoxin oxidoreductase family protein [Anaerolineae bacterium]|nr:aldehyde ferredoxin oxidoreductase family protein [Anaerolineae bacterium]
MMARGYMGKILNVDLTKGTVQEEALDEQLCRDYIGGYGIGARLLYERMPAGADPLGPDNILGVLTGPLTGTPAIIGSRFVVVGKSPNTGGWGDANCGGFFGPHMKFAGVDGALFYGIAASPVYLYIEGGKGELRDASDLWGMNVSDLEDLLKARHGDDVEVISIGTAGEKMSLMACIMNDKERAAGRSGLGAVMGSKKLKAVVVKGDADVPMADRDRILALRREYLRRRGGAYDDFHTYGTCAITSDSAQNGDSPVKNWGGSGLVDFPRERSDKIGGEANVALPGYKSYGCWYCPIRCGGKVRQDSGPYALEKNDGVGHQPEYETLCMFGTNLLNDDLASIVKINEICNNHGLDTISVGATIGYVVECYEAGLIGVEQTDGLEMTWGNAPSIVAMTHKIAAREGCGELFADGIKAAWERLGRIGTEYAIHVGGEEVPAHDPRYTPGLASTYTLDATPGRHTQGGELLAPVEFELEEHDKYVYSGSANNHWQLVNQMHVVNAAGLCMFGYLSYPWESVPSQLSAVTGWDYDQTKVLETGMRIGTMRHAFNLREGHNPLTRNVPGRLIGEPPLTEGNVKGITVDLKTLNREYLERCGWDTRTTIPSEEALRELGLDFLVEDSKHWRVPAV